MMVSVVAIEKLVAGELSLGMTLVRPVVRTVTYSALMKGSSS